MAWQATQEAARRPPSTPGLIRRSGRIPGLPYPPIKLLHCTAVANIALHKSSTLEENCDKSWGAWGAKPLKELPPEMRDLPHDSARDIKSRSPSLQLMYLLLMFVLKGDVPHATYIHRRCATDIDWHKGLGRAVRQTTSATCASKGECEDRGSGVFDRRETVIRPRGVT